jgi:Domain of unknown function (DUF6531)
MHLFSTWFFAKFLARRAWPFPIIFADAGWFFGRLVAQTRLALLAQTSLALLLLLSFWTPAAAEHWTASWNGQTCVGGPQPCAIWQWEAIYGSSWPEAPFTCTMSYDPHGNASLMACANHPWLSNPAYTLTGYSSPTCDGDEQPGATGCALHDPKMTCPKEGDPVSVIPGVLNEEVTDFTTGGDHPFFLKRYYWSDHWTEVTFPSRMGGAWSTNFDAAASYRGNAQSPSTVNIRMPDGRVLVFNVFGQNNTQQSVYNFAQNTWQNMPGVAETLTYAGNGNWVLVDQDDISYTFNSAGQLVTVQYRD